MLLWLVTKVQESWLMLTLFQQSKANQWREKEPGTVNRAGEGRTLSIVPVSQISNGRLSEGNEGGDWKIRLFSEYDWNMILEKKKHTIILKAEWLFKPGKDSKRFIKWFDFGSGKGNMLRVIGTQKLAKSFWQWIIWAISTYCHWELCNLHC